MKPHWAAAGIKGETGQNWVKPSVPVVPEAETCSWWQHHIAWVVKRGLGSIQFVVADNIRFSTASTTMEA